MDLKKLGSMSEIHGEEIAIMDLLKEKYPEHFDSKSGQMDYKWFEEKIRSKKFVQVRWDKNSISFTLQKGDEAEVGKNGCSLNKAIEIMNFLTLFEGDCTQSEENDGS